MLEPSGEGIGCQTGTSSGVVWVGKSLVLYIQNTWTEDHGSGPAILLGGLRQLHTDVQVRVTQPHLRDAGMGG